MYQVSRFLLSVASADPACPLLASLLESQLYPLLNSLLHCRFQDPSTTASVSAIPFDFQCFVQESPDLILSLVALGSYMQIRAGLKAFQHFLAVYSPCASWIAYGRKLEHRRLCFQIYQKWNEISDGAFISQNGELYALATIHVLLDSQSTSELIAQIATALRRCSTDVFELTKAAVSLVSRPVQGVLQFMPLCIEDISSVDWRHYCSRLCRQLDILTPMIAPGGRVSVQCVYELMLKKEELVRQETGPFSQSNPAFLALALSKITQGGDSNRLHDSAMAQLLASLGRETSSIVLQQCLTTITSAPPLVQLTLKSVANRIDYIIPNNQVLRLICECMNRDRSAVPPCLFSPTSPIPDSARPLYAVFVWAMIVLRRPLLNLSGWLRWIIQGGEEAQELINRFEPRYQELCRCKPVTIDFGLALHDGSDDDISRLMDCMLQLLDTPNMAKMLKGVRL